MRANALVGGTKLVPQVKVYALESTLTQTRATLSDTIHSCLVDALAIPQEKRFHRFFPLPPEDFIYPADRTDRYVIIEISLFEGRTPDAKRHLLRLLASRVSAALGTTPQDIEVTLSETPRANWSIRGVPADELQLNYAVEGTPLAREAGEG